MQMMQSPLNIRGELARGGKWESIEPLLKNVDLMKSGDEYLQAAIFYGKEDVVKKLIIKGADINYPPPSLIAQKIESDKKNQSIISYRQTPYAMQAVRSGSVTLLNMILKMQS